MGAMQLHWDIFCRVIDNHGDIGVCWRLARQLASEQGKAVRLWVDDLGSLKPMSPVVDVQSDRQICEGVEIRRWTKNIAFDLPGEVVIEAFACELPINYLQAMAEMVPKPCWINLEYLTAESWVDGYHGLASPHPFLPLVKYFYFPGFTVASGGRGRGGGTSGTDRLSNDQLARTTERASQARSASASAEQAPTLRDGERGRA